MSVRVLYTDIPCLDHGLSGKAQGYASVRRPLPGAKVDHRAKNPKVLFHRWVFWEHHGFLPDVVMHLCDNPRCIEITHLTAGTWSSNNKDRAQKGRSAPFVTSRQRLTPAQVVEIRERFAMRKLKDPVNGPCALAREFGVDTNVIYQLVDGRTYRNVA